MTECFQFCSASSGNSISSSNDGATYSVKHHHQDHNGGDSPNIMLSAEDRQKKKEMDSLLSEAMKTLTFKEQQEQLEALHGVAHEMTEEPSLIENAIRDLDDCLKTTKEGTAYEAAERRSNEYVSNRPFRLMFLRANRYDSKAAADQMLMFFEAKQKLFGAEKLVKDITMKDLDEDDLACLRTGCFQHIGYDRSNRAVVFQGPGLRAFRILDNELRLRYYLTMRLLRSEGVQRRGAVAIRYSVGNLKDNKNGEGYLEHIRLRKSLPIRYEGVHVASDDPRQVLLANVALAAMGSKLRTRYRIHHGSHVECLYKLATYGISAKILPLTATYDIDLKLHMEWFQSCLMDDMSSHFTAAQSPILTTELNANDALFMCCKKSHTSGNDRLRKLVKETSGMYDAGNYETKKSIADKVINEIQEPGGRFLQHVKGSVAVWEVLPPKEIRAKTTQLFRNYRRSSSKNNVKERTLVSAGALPNDVVFGRSERNRGTNLLHCLIKDRFEEYEALNRGKKLIVVNSIVDQLKGEGSRFLQPTKDFRGYVELSDELVRNRVSKYFQNHRRRKSSSC
ncbi:unnamed protein product [Cylindrotheca closterium]|uniref:DUF6824 domain-containing protein n=1 Tax=Cylindrotheca closterium TaxID=2856 RepID=A0AAD2CF38_9STRA|nr:unnamed protein product [Cylindrotheca closterium]